MSKIKIEMRLPARTRLRLILDTNIWLDWLVFGDPSIAPIRAAVAAKRAEVFIDAACEAELVASAEAEAEAGFPGQKESELAVVRALLRLILSPNVRMPLSRLQ